MNNRLSELGEMSNSEPVPRENLKFEIVTHAEGQGPDDEEIHETTSLEDKTDEDTSSAGSFVVDQAEPDGLAEDSEYDTDNITLASDRSSDEDYADMTSADERDEEAGITSDSEHDVEDSERNEEVDDTDQLEDLQFADQVIDRSAFIEIVREIAEQYKTEIHFEAAAIDAIQEVTEEYIATLFANAHDIALHAGRDYIRELFAVPLAVRLRTNRYIL